jgi:hypothetical protein
MSEALEKAAEKTPAIIETPEQYRGALLRWQSQHFNILTPYTNLSGLAPGYAMIAAVVTINPEAMYADTKVAGAGDVYGGLPWLKGRRGADDEELALLKGGLRKIADGGAVSTDTLRTDPRTIPHFWEFKATASYVGIDGKTITRTATVEWDLREGSPRINGWKPDQVKEGRKNGLRNCEARAINAALRELGIKQKYTRAELAKPFVIVRVVFQPDMTDPAIKALVTSQAMQGVSRLYPGAAAALPAHEQVVDAEVEEDPRPVGRGSTTGPAKPVEDQPPTVDAVRIVKATPKSGETKGKAWTRYLIVDSTGLESSTFEKSLYDLAVKCRDDRTWVELTTETNGLYSNLIEITVAGTAPTLPGLTDL